MWKAKRKKKFKNRKIYIHYGSNFLNKDMPMKDWFDNSKPKGIWASPKYTNWGWKDFCENENFNTNKLELSFEFKLKRKSRVLKVKDFKDIKPYLKEIKDRDFWWGEWWDDGKYELDLDKIYNNFDAMELFMSNNYGYFHNYSRIFTMWDVNSLVVWNFDIIEPIKKKAD